MTTYNRQSGDFPTSLGGGGAKILVIWVPQNRQGKLHPSLCNFEPSKIMIVDHNFGPSKIMVVDRNFGPSKIMIVDHNFGPSQIMVVDRNFGQLFLTC